MKIITVVAAGIIGVNIVACASFDPTLKGLIKIDTGTNPPANQGKDRATNVINHPTGTSKEEGCTVLPVRNSFLDVDTLYGRAMARFGFKSPEQIAIYRKTVDRFYLVDQGYKHEKQGGSFYHLAQTVASGVPKASRAIWLEFTFAKSGTASDVTAEFCVDPKDPIGSSNEVRSQIASRVMSVLTK